VALEQVSRFARLAADNLDVSKPILASIGSPVQVKQTWLGGSSTSLDVVRVEVAVVVSLMFVTLLLAAGMLALEREEHAFGRLVRGLVSRTALLARRSAWRRCALGARARDAGGAGGVLGPRLGARARLAARARRRRARVRGAGRGDRRLAREVRAASLLAFMLALPIAALALIPSGAVERGLYDAIRIVSARSRSSRLTRSTRVIAARSRRCSTSRVDARFGVIARSRCVAC
jgi:ABC-2 type transport system permease protein